MKREWVEYSQGNMKPKASMVDDDKVAGKRPAEFMLHARDGMTESTLRHAEV